MEKIIITGTPGTGKTSVSKELADLIKAELLSINQIVIENNFVSSYDEKRNTYIVDSNKLITFLKRQIKFYNGRNFDFVIIEGHYADILPGNLIDYLFILRCHPKKLRDRLSKKGVNEESVKENVQAEILGNSINFVLEKIDELKKIPILEIDTSNKSIKGVAKLISEIIHKKVKYDDFYIGNVDWLEEISNEDKIFEYF
ncbi:MAG: adenylate kinase family protein [Candidatus Lokiarchaeota archaeon]